VLLLTCIALDLNSLMAYAMVSNLDSVSNKKIADIKNQLKKYNLIIY
jgi:hypothetical protein